MNKKIKLGLIIGVSVVIIGIGLTLFLTLSKVISGNNPIITLSQYEQLEKDMTYDKAVEILGSNGTLQANDIVKVSADYIVTYVWYGKNEGSKAVITFNRNLLGAKTYIGLTD